ncbi:glycine cleavage system protein GcvH [Marinobacterium stanieri]|uniref:Glycine cleavage system H protein n=1 Tax=Marinobacterium stanieri TaxID=49186 RepID=A0A1N6VX25_9GAMM|nr:glycine cleavage system protein GcvH [Marinobacterium stanieri]SIQ82176.1 glycine cleavage system H protein [Marinobacterium stanieri]
MSNVPNELKYVASHEWIREEGEGVVVVGITDHAQDLLGDVVFVELPDVGAEMSAGDDAGVVESVKAASDIYAPLSGEVVAVNEDLEDAPEMVNSDPYGDGWFFKIKLSDTAELEDLLDADGYAAHCEAES